MFHNNWIVSSDAKMYRLKELGLFFTQSDYYSNPENRFITYKSLPFNATIEEEERVLKTALLLAIRLKRILILPKFHCHKEAVKENQLDIVYRHPRNHCTLNAYWCIRDFDAFFGEFYREHISFCFLLAASFMEGFCQQQTGRFGSKARVPRDGLGIDQVAILHSSFAQARSVCI